MQPWRSAIVDSADGSIRYRGYDATSLMMHRTFTETIFLLHRGRLPSEAERSVLDAILIGVADHGSGAPSCAAARIAFSGNRQSVSAAVAAGILAVGDDHGGAGMGCMDMIASALARVRSENLSLEQAATRIIKEARQEGRRIAGLGHRVHHADPRTPVLFDLARKNGIAGQGVAFMETLEKLAAQMIKPLPINIDGSLAAVLHDMEFEPAFGRLVFLIGRTAGLCAEVAEELGREKPMRIKIPVEYDGEPPRSLQ